MDLVRPVRDTDAPYASTVKSVSDAHRKAFLFTLAKEVLEEEATPVKSKPGLLSIFGGSTATSSEPSRPTQRRSRAHSAPKPLRSMMRIGGDTSY